ncbi:hypothetical protein JL39_20360 [Rhizobium sp. YS-1r]|nr:hypothetical protein JL39_20360 [Rhizobium sp. YS-1r]
MLPLRTRLQPTQMLILAASQMVAGPVVQSGLLGAPMNAGSRGLLKLMIRFPAIRGELQILYGHDETLKELAEAYE